MKTIHVATEPIISYPVVGDHNNIFEIDELIAAVASALLPRELLIMREVSRSCKRISDGVILDSINKNRFQISDFGIKKIAAAINFLGEENCSKIKALSAFNRLAADDISKISDLFTNLEYLYLNSANITGFGKLPFLKKIFLCDGNIESLNFLENFPSLESLKISRCNESDDYTPISKFCTSLTSLTLTSSPTNIEFIKELPLKKLVFEARLTQDFTPVTSLTSLQKLMILRSAISEDLLYTLQGRKLVKLDVRVCTGITENFDLSGFNSLESLSVFATKFKAISSLQNFENLRTLNISHCPIEDLSPLSFIPLEILHASRINAKDENFIQQHSPITNSLSCFDFSENILGNFSCIGHLTALKELYLRHCCITDISFAAGLQLHTLDLSGNNQISNIELLKDSKLETIFLQTCETNVNEAIDRYIETQYNKTSGCAIS